MDDKRTVVLELTKDEVNQLMAVAISANTFTLNNPVSNAYIRFADKFSKIATKIYDAYQTSGIPSRYNKEL